MTVLNPDILYDIVDHILLFSRGERNEILSRLSSTCKELNNAIRPILFHDIRWPHKTLSKVNGSHHLVFLPEIVWIHVCEFNLQWPEEWPETFLDYSYHKVIDRMGTALPQMTNLRVFQMTWPLSPPTALLTTLSYCPSLKVVRIIDTPLFDLSRSPNLSNIECMTLVPVAEAVRTGEGPFDYKFRELQYFARPYRKRHRQKPNVTAAHQYIFQTGLTRSVRYLQISTQYLQSLVSLSSSTWAALETLVLTGPALPIGVCALAPVIHQMPKLFDMRLLLARKLGQYGDDQLSPELVEGFPRIKHLSLSSSYEVSGLLKLTSSLERLSITAISRHPQIPIAMTGAELMHALQGLEDGGGNLTLKRLRIMTEDDLTVELFKKLGRICPKLEFVEVELCGYRDGEAGFEWTDYADVFSTYLHLQELRIGIPFADCEEPCKTHGDLMECIRCDRRDCAIYFASRVSTLRFIGFEYRMRTGSYRKEDRWLDYEVVRFRDGNVALLEIAQTWYPFPEVWERDLLYDS